MLDVDKYLNKHPNEDSVDIDKEDLKEAKKELVDLIEKEGTINNVHYKIEYGKEPGE